MGNFCCSTGGASVRPAPRLRNPSRTSSPVTIEGRCFSKPGNEMHVAICGHCRKACSFVEGHRYFRCLECPNNFNLCEKCEKKDLHQKDHLFAIIDCVKRQETLEELTKANGGWPTLQLCLPMQRLVFPPTCSALIEGEGGVYGVTTCRSQQIQYMCLQCPMYYAVCEKCMGAEEHHDHHLFAVADTEGRQHFLWAQYASGNLPLEF